jgi:hypothetical protein
LDLKIAELKQSWRRIVCQVESVDLITRNNNEPFSILSKVHFGVTPEGISAPVAHTVRFKQESIASVVNRLQAWIEQQRNASQLPKTATRLENAIRCMCHARVQCDAAAVCAALEKDGLVTSKQWRGETSYLISRDDGHRHRSLEAPAQAWAGSPSTDNTYYSLATIEVPASGDDLHTPASSSTSNKSAAPRSSTFKSTSMTRTWSSTASTSASASASTSASTSRMRFGSSYRKDTTTQMHHEQEQEQQVVPRTRALKREMVDIPFPTEAEQQEFALAKARIWISRLPTKGTIPLKVFMAELQCVCLVKFELDACKFIEKLVKELQLVQLDTSGHLIWPSKQ